MTGIQMTIRLLISVGLCLVANALQANGQEKYFHAGDVRLHYSVLGEGSPVVLVHGFTSSGATWQQSGIAQTLAARHRVLLLDARGHGQSDKPHSSNAYGERMASDVIALLDHEGVSQAHLVGYSMGGLLTLKAITLAPQRFVSAVVGG